VATGVGSVAVRGRDAEPRDGAARAGGGAHGGGLCEAQGSSCKQSMTPTFNYVP